MSLSHFVLLGKLPTKFALLLLSVPCKVAAGCMTVCTRRVNVATRAKFFFALVTINVTIDQLFDNQLISGKLIAGMVTTKLCLIDKYCFTLATYK